MDVFDYGFFILLSILLAIFFSKLGEKLKESREKKFDFKYELRKRIEEWWSREKEEYETKLENE